MYQVELKVNSIGGIFPFVVDGKSKEKAVKNAIIKFRSGFECYINKKVSVYNVFNLEKG